MCTGTKESSTSRFLGWWVPDEEIHSLVELLSSLPADIAAWCGAVARAGCLWRMKGLAPQPHNPLQPDFNTRTASSSF